MSVQMIIFKTKYQKHKHEDHIMTSVGKIRSDYNKTGKLNAITSKHI